MAVVTEAPAKEDLPEIDISDVLDYSYCGLLVWWKKFAPEAEREESLSGEDLMRTAVRETIRQKYSGADGTPAEILGRIWRAWLKNWGIPEINRALSEYASAYRKLLDDFSEKGNFRRRDGSAYIKPSWSSKWKEQYTARGLEVLHKQIGDVQHLAGLPPINAYVGDDPRFPPPMGLAEAYAISLSAISQFDKLPASVLGVRIRLETTLPSLRLNMVADLVTSIGSKKGPGRPSDSSDHMKQVVQYEMHLYDEAVPSIGNYLRDRRIQALFFAHPPDMLPESIQTNSILVRHMRSGKYNIINNKNEGGLLGLETAARMAYNGIRSGVFMPRSLFGMDSCSDCRMRPRCFVGEGVLERLSLNVGSDSGSQFSNYLHKYFDRDKVRKEHLKTMEEIFRWLLRNPSVSYEQALWILRSYLGS
jgi:hypothetical protein